MAGSNAAKLPNTARIREQGARTKQAGPVAGPAHRAVYAGAGFLPCGLTLVRQQVENGELRLAFPVARGVSSKNAYRVRFGLNTLKRNPVARYREWLLAVAEQTTAEIRTAIGGEPSEWQA